MIDLTKDELDGYKNDLLLGSKIHASVIDEIFTLALCGFEMQWKPIDQAPKDGTDILAFGGRRGSQMSGHEYEVNHEGPTVVSWESGHWWELGEMCNYVKPTKFILLSALREPK